MFELYYVEYSVFWPEHRHYAVTQMPVNYPVKAFCCLKCQSGLISRTVHLEYTCTGTTSDQMT